MTNELIYDWNYDALDLSDTETLGRRLGEFLVPGTVIALIGQLGAGKTHLTRAIAQGLQIRNPAVVTSPTFVLIQEYHARLPIAHFDAYRLRDDREFLDLGADEYFRGDGVCIVEWADRVPDVLPPDRLEIRIEVLGPNSRRFHIRGYGSQCGQIVERLRDS